MAQDCLRLTGRQAQEYLLGWTEATRALSDTIAVYGRDIALTSVWKSLGERMFAPSIRNIGWRDALKVALGEE